MLRAYAFVSAMLLSACAAPTRPPPQDASAITGADWQVMQVNGRQVPAAADYWVRFGDDNRIGAKFGCNSMGGTYSVSGSALTVSDLMQTLMGCPEPAATFENEGSAILRAPMTMSRSYSDRAPYEYLSLKNQAGEIILNRRT